MKEIINNKAAISVPSHPMYLSIIRVFLERLFRLIDLPGSVIEDLKSAVDEACSNIIKYAYKNDYSKTIKVSFYSTPSEIVVVLEDKGCKPDSEAFRGRELDDLRPGGLGMHFIKKAFHKVSFHHTKNGNKLKLVRYMKDEDNR